MVKYLSTFILVLIHYSLSAQTVVNTDYIITNEGDTINGDITLKKRVSDNILFSTSGQESIRYYAIQLKGFRVDGKIFISHAVPQHEDIPKQLFIEKLSFGRATLYYSRPNFLIQKKGDDEFYLLEPYDEKIIHKVGETYKQSTNFIGILKWLMNDCEAVKDEFDQLNFRKKQIIELVKRYNSCDVVNSNP